MKRLPKVLVNFAMTADGKISTRNGTASNFTSMADKRRLSEIRAMGDALIVGRKTVVSDAMSMGLSHADLHDKRLMEGKTAVPLRVIVSETGKFDPGWRVFSNSDSPLVLCSAQKIPESLANKFPDFVQIVQFPRGKSLIARLLKLLHRRWGVKQIVCEGGATLFKSLLNDDLVDDLYITIAPVIFGGGKSISLSGLPLGFLPHEHRFRLKSLETHGGEAFLHYLRDRRPPPNLKDSK